MDFTILACPKDASRLERPTAHTLVCQRGHVFPIVDGVPVLLRDDVEQTHHVAARSLSRARNEPGAADARNPDLYLESLGISEAEKEMAVRLDRQRTSKVDPVVSVIVGATSGNAYSGLIGHLEEYPIPDIRLPAAKGELLLDIGCNWGRWSVSATRKGYRVIGIDPSLGGIMAAKRVARDLGLEIDFVCADGRSLPFVPGTFDTVFSYSVIQHFSKPDAKATLNEVGRVLKASGRSLIQMPNMVGIRSFYHLARRGFTPGEHFDVRYWTLGELTRTFESSIGPSRISVHCYFGLGLEPSDAPILQGHARVALAISEFLRPLSERVGLLTQVADSVYVASTKRQERNQTTVDERARKS